MPFITEELWQALADRKEGESIMVAQMPEIKEVNKELLAKFEKTKEVVSGIRTIRLQKNIPNKDALNLQIIGAHDASLDALIVKMANLSSVEKVEEKDATAAGFLVGAVEYAVKMEGRINVEEEIAKMEKEIVYLQGFLKGVNAKLSNERFVANAKPEIVENERKKKADAEGKIAVLEESIAKLKN
jgi:valyl-tRNA synthetase